MEGRPAENVYGEIRIMNLWIVQETMLQKDSQKFRHEELKKHETHESGQFEELFLEALAKTV